MKCAVCSSTDHNLILNLDCGGFDNSTLYRKLKVLKCNNCGHVFNYLTASDISGLYEYYQTEYSKCNIESPNKTGDIPGSSSEASITRYSNLYSLIRKFVTSDSKLLDVGCANGGFLNFLTPVINRFNLFGIEPSALFADKAAQVVGKSNIFCAVAENLPFEENTLDIVVADQVVEHLFDPNIFFAEANRVLKNCGKLCVSVPYVNAYNGNSFFDFYFFLMREHIHHFGIYQLSSLASKHGFFIEDYSVNFTQLISSSGKLPNLTVVFSKNNVKYNNINEKFNDVCDYIYASYEELFSKIKHVESLINNYEQISVYGMSREFHYIWANTNLSRCKNIKLFDDTPTKQLMSVDGISIRSSDYIGEYDNVLITSFAHIEKMKHKLIEKGFNGKFI